MGFSRRRADQPQHFWAGRGSGGGQGYPRGAKGPTQSYLRALPLATLARQVASTTAATLLSGMDKGTTIDQVRGGPEARPRQPFCLGWTKERPSTKFAGARNGRLVPPDDAFWSVLRQFGCLQRPATRARLLSFSCEERNLDRALADRAPSDWGWGFHGGGPISRSTFGRGVGVGVGKVILGVQRDQHKATYARCHWQRSRVRLRARPRQPFCLGWTKERPSTKFAGARKHDRGNPFVWDGQRNDHRPSSRGPGTDGSCHQMMHSGAFCGSSDACNAPRRGHAC